MARSYRAREPPPQRGRRDFYFHWRARWSAAAEFGEGLVRRDGGETFARGLALGSQIVDQAQGRTPWRAGPSASLLRRCIRSTLKLNSTEMPRLSVLCFH